MRTARRDGGQCGRRGSLRRATSGCRWNAEEGQDWAQDPFPWGAPYRLLGCPAPSAPWSLSWACGWSCLPPEQHSAHLLLSVSRATEQPPWAPAAPECLRGAPTAPLAGSTLGLELQDAGQAPRTVIQPRQSPRCSVRAERCHRHIWTTLLGRRAFSGLLTCSPTL